MDSPMERLVAGLKTCSRCGSEKPLEAFSRNRGSADGRVAWCKDCYRAWASDNRDKTRAAGHRHRKTGKYRQTQAGYRATGKIKAWRKKAQKKQLQNPLVRFKIYIRSATHAAVQAGLIVKKGCEVCRSVEVQAHHTDYGKPLEVRWLCALHHSDLHKGENET